MQWLGSGARLATGHDPVVPEGAAPAFGERLGVAVVAALGDLGAPGDGIPGRVGPLDRGGGAHQAALLPSAVWFYSGSCSARVRWWGPGERVGRVDVGVMLERTECFESEPVDPLDAVAPHGAQDLSRERGVLSWLNAPFPRTWCLMRHLNRGG